MSFSWLSWMSQILGKSQYHYKYQIIWKVSKLCIFTTERNIIQHICFLSPKINRHPTCWWNMKYVCVIQFFVFLNRCNLFQVSIISKCQELDWHKFSEKNEVFWGIVTLLGSYIDQSEQILHNTDKYEMLIKKVRKEKKITRHPK